jgi:hypothetical protein
VIVPLRADAMHPDLIDPAARVSFDLDGFGARTWTWITSEAGWLVFDPRRTGRITSGLQLFGNVTFWRFWNTDYDALQALDDDGNGHPARRRAPRTRGVVRRKRRWRVAGR